MPKLGADPHAGEPYNLRCSICGCLVEKVISRFGFNGKPAAWAYRCALWGHQCGTVDREACKPYRAYGEPIAHVLNDGAGGIWEHPGKVEDCPLPDCADKGHDALTGGVRHPGTLMDCTSEACEPPFDRGDPWASHPASDVATEGDTSWLDPDPRPDPLAPCPRTGREHRWTWADDGNGHSGDVCACGAFEE